jgi:5-methylcytosine-specific restriction endonuclease McrA
MTGRIYNTPEWKRLRLLVLARDGYTCMIPTATGGICGRTARAVDHIVPLAEGGAPFDQLNCRAACQSCNSRINNERRAELARRAIAHDLHQAGLNTSRTW